MPTENQIDCPALHKRSGSYPFGNRVPRTVRMLKTVTADPMPGIGLSYIKGDAPVAKEGQTYRVWTNSHGAVTAVMGNGVRLGLRPAEFEVDTWHHLADEPTPRPHPEPIAWMVGTAIWWTKEEAERDAAAIGLPIVGLGPMTGAAPAEQHQGEPVGALLIGEYFDNREIGDVDVHLDSKVCEQLAEKYPGQSLPLYTRADPVEVERLRSMFDQTDADLRSATAERDTLRAEADRLRQEVASIDKKLRGNVSDPDPLKPIMPGALSVTTTYGLVAGIVRERDQLKKALERQTS